MNNTNKLVIAVALVVGAMGGAVLRGTLVTPASAQATVAATSEVGRYQIVPAGSAMNPFIYYVDTKEGRAWLAFSPAESAKPNGFREIKLPTTLGAKEK